MYLHENFCTGFYAPKFAWNWDRITEILGRPYGEFSEADFAALAVVLALIPDEDLARYFNAMGEKIGIGQTSVSVLGSLPEEQRNNFLAHDTMWHFCQDKIAGIQRHLEGMIFYLLGREMAGTRHSEQWISDRNERWELMQRSYLLTIMSSFSAMLWEDDSDGVNRQLRNVISGTSDSPGLRVMRDENGSYVFNFIMMNKYINPSAPVGCVQPIPGNENDNMWLRDWRENSFTVPSPIHGAIAARHLNEQTTEHMLQNHQHDWVTDFALFGAGVASAYLTKGLSVPVQMEASAFVGGAGVMISAESAGQTQRAILEMDEEWRRSIDMAAFYLDVIFATGESTSIYDGTPRTYFSSGTWMSCRTQRAFNEFIKDSEYHHGDRDYEEMYSYINGIYSHNFIHPDRVQ